MVVEIGRNKRAQQAYAFDDVAIVPSRRTRGDEEVSLGYPREWKGRKPNPPRPVRRILPADPGRKASNHLMMRAAGAARPAVAQAPSASVAVAASKAPPNFNLDCDMTSSGRTARAAGWPMTT